MYFIHVRLCLWCAAEELGEKAVTAGRFGNLEIAEGIMQEVRG